MTIRAYTGRVPPDELRKRCDPAQFRFETTDELAVTETIIGQDRAVKAIRIGLDLPSPGFNIFVAGHSGTGRNTTIDRFLSEIPKHRPVPPDLAYVNCFKAPDRPRLLTFEAGQASRFRDAMERFIAGLRRSIPAVLASEEYGRQRKAVLEGYREQQRRLLKDLENAVENAGFRLVQLTMGPIVRPSLLPVVAGEAVGMDQLDDLVAAGKLAKAEAERLEERYAELEEDLESTLIRVREIDAEAQSRLERLDADLILPLVHDPLIALAAENPGDSIRGYLDEVEESLMEGLSRFREETGPEHDSDSSRHAPHSDPFLEYRVNVIVDNGSTVGAPVVNETSPTHKNLFGAIEKTVDRTGEWKSHYTQIKAGSFLQANGGYLVLNATDVLSEAGVWPSLKRTLRTGVSEIQSYDPVFMFTTSVLKPEGIPCNVKVVLVGSHEVYRVLYEADPDFSKIFKVKAEFDTVMRVTPDAVAGYASFIRRVTHAENLLPYDRTGVAELVEHGFRRAGRGERLSTKFTEIADVLREASWQASRNGSTRVSSSHVREALASRRERVSLSESKIRESVDEGTLLLDVQGARVGQINGLTFYDLGDSEFGVPTRITATLSMGREGVVNIEREVEMSGPTHSKGVLILAGYLRSLFARDKPLTLSASLCFEQSYGAIDGDSASSTEVYALLSAIAEAPLRQSMAVTGSINQRGEIQPIGGVNDKIEGWFAACKARGLTGDQGVLIPSLNVQDLMLDSEIVEAARQGLFAVHAVSHVAEGIELLTGLPAGERTGEGTFPEGTIFGRVDRRLREMGEALRRFGPLAQEGD